jgi:hypothetical protein
VEKHLSIDTIWMTTKTNRLQGLSNCLLKIVVIKESINDITQNGKWGDPKELNEYIFGIGASKCYDT